MSTPINFATQVYLANNTSLSSGKIVPTVDDGFGNGLAGSVILTAPVLGPGGSGAVYVTGTFNVPNFGLYSALSPDATGYSTSQLLPFHDRTSFVTAAPTTQTATYGFGTGLESYDAAVAAGEFYIIVNPGNYWNEITAISFDYTAPGSTTTPVNTAVPLRQFPRDDGRQTASALRNFPPPKSYQSSIRRGGGYL